jgi:hypothetical protein
MPKKNKSATSFRLNPELMRTIAHECIDRGITQTQAIEEGLRLWLKLESGGTTNIAVPKNITVNLPSRDTNYQSVTGLEIPAEKCMELLRDILSSGHEVAVSAISANLIAFDLLVKKHSGVSSENEQPDSADDETAERQLQKDIELSRAESDRARDIDRSIRQRHGIDPGDVPLSGRTKNDRKKGA